MTRIREPDLEPPRASRRGTHAYGDDLDDGASGDYATGTAHRMADGLRALATTSRGTSGGTLGLADAITALFTHSLRFDSADPQWPDRDRVVLPAGGGAEALLAAALDLTGHASPHASGPSPSLSEHTAVEAVTGPAGQCVGIGVGLALAERLLAARFGRSLVDHRTWVLAAPSDLASGLSHEAACLAGHLGLGRLTVLWEDDGSCGLAGTADELKRLAAVGWTTRRVSGRDSGALLAALALAERSRKPTLIACSVTEGGTEGPFPPFALAPELRARWEAAGTRAAAARRGWKKRTARHALRGEFDRVSAGRLPDEWTTALAALRGEAATGSAAFAGLLVAGAMAASVPELVGAAPGGVPGLSAVGPDRFNARLVSHGSRPHGLAACTAGLALHGGVVPFALSGLSDGDAVRPALRFLSAARRRAVFLLCDDASPDQVAALRSVPGLHLHRPADGAEAAECWELALRRTDGPSAIVLSTRDDMKLSRADTAENRCARGGYVLAEADGPRQATLVAAGAEVPVAMQARAELAASGVAVAVVSLPCRELFALQPATETAPVLGNVTRVAIAGADALGLRRWLGPHDLLLDHEDDLTPGAVAQSVRKRLPTEEEKPAS